MTTTNNKKSVLCQTQKSLKQENRIKFLEECSNEGKLEQKYGSL